MPGVKKAAAKRKTTTTAEDEIEQYLNALNARRQFLGAALNVGWRLAITVLVPIIAGVKLDQRFGTTPSLTLAAFMLAMVASAAIVWGTIKEINQEQAEEEAAEKKEPKQE